MNFISDLLPFGCSTLFASCPLHSWKNRNLIHYRLSINISHLCLSGFSYFLSMNLINIKSLKLYIPRRFGIIRYTVAPHQWHSSNVSNWKTGGARFKPRSRLSTKLFGVFGGFLRNSRKYGLGIFSLFFNFKYIYSTYKVSFYMPCKIINLSLV